MLTPRGKQFVLLMVGAVGIVGALMGVGSTWQWWGCQVLIGLFAGMLIGSAVLLSETIETMAVEKFDADNNLIRCWVCEGTGKLQTTPRIQDVEVKGDRL